MSQFSGPAGGASGITTASNGLTAAVGNVKLGGALTQNTSITGTNTYSLDITGMLSSTFSGTTSGVTSSLSHGNNLFGITGFNGSGTFAGDGATPGTSTNGSVNISGISGGKYYNEYFTFSPSFYVTGLANSADGNYLHEVINLSAGNKGSTYLTSRSAEIKTTTGAGGINRVIVDLSSESTSVENTDATTENYAVRAYTPLGGIQKIGFNIPKASAALTSTVTDNGSFASNVTYVSADYTVDSQDSSVPDNTIAVFTDILGGTISITMPSAANFIGREIGIYNVGQDMNSLQDVRVSFVGTEFQGTLGEDYISATPYELKLYKSVKDHTGTPIWILKYTNRTLNGYKFYNYDTPSVIAGTEDGITYGFGEDSSTVGSPTMDISSASAPNIPLGTTLTVKDIGGKASVMNIVIDAGTDDIIQRNVIIPTLVLNTDGGSYTLQKMYNSVDGRTYWMVIAVV